MESLLALLRDRGPLPMAELSEFRDVSRSKTGQEIAELVRLGLVKRSGLAPSRGGRPSSIVRLSDDLRYVGVEIGATSIGVALTNGYLEVLDFVEEPADVRPGPEPVLERARELIRQISKTSKGPVPVAGVGIGLPSPVSFREGKPIVPPLMPGWDGYPVRDQLSEQLAAPVTVDNDVNVMALGELHAGVARGIADFLFIKLGTGIGCGIVVHGSLYRGESGCAGDIGHISVGNSTVLCHCGRTGCLEAQFGGAALARQAVVAAQSGESPLLAGWLADQGRLTAEDVARASAAGDPAANRLIRSGGQLLGSVLSGLVNFFNPSMIVVGGGLAQLGPLLLAETRSVVLNRSTPLATNELSIVLSRLGDHVGVVGAAWLASERFIDSFDHFSPLGEGSGDGKVTHKRSTGAGAKS